MQKICFPTGFSKKSLCFSKINVLSQVGLKQVNRSTRAKIQARRERLEGRGPYLYPSCSIRSVSMAFNNDRAREGARAWEVTRMCLFKFFNRMRVSYCARTFYNFIILIF